MFTVGLTGGVASGKTTASNFFKNKGIEIVDADEISRDLQNFGSKGYKEIVKKFGKKILDPTNEINRKLFREIVFSSTANKKWLENLMHPMIKTETIKKFAAIKSKWAIYSAPLWSFKNVFKRILVIDVPADIQLKRITERDKCTIKTAKEMICAQINSNERNNFATDLIVNDETLEVFNNKLNFYFNLFTQLANKKEN